VGWASGRSDLFDRLVRITAVGGNSGDPLDMIVFVV
jgi:hypothetical protein